MLYRKRSIALFVLPSIIGFSIFYAIPFLGGIYYSLVNNAFDKHFVGLSNYIEILKSEAFLLAMKNTILFTVLCVPLITLLSLFAALLVKNVPMGGSLFRSGLVLPLVIPSASVVLVWSILFSNYGHLNSLLDSIGIKPVLWMSGTNFRWVIVFLYLWHNCGYNMIIFLGGLNTIPKSVYESAMLDGAGRWASFRKITMPMLFPTTFFVIIMSIINSFKIFKEAYLLGGAYPPETAYLLQHYMNNQFERLNYTRLTTAACLFALIIYGITLLLFRIEKRFVKGVW